MSKITTFLTYDHQAEAAVTLYTSVFKRSRITKLLRYGEGTPFPAGTAMTIEFELDGQRFMALNGGPHFKFSEGISLSIDCETQAEIDSYSEQLTAGGAQGPCGWVTDRFGVSWQIVPTILSTFLADPDPAKSARVMQAMMQMTRFDIAALVRAHEGQAR